MRSDEPASRYFPVAELPFKGRAKVRMWISILAAAVVNGGFGGFARPARLCIVDGSGTVLYEERHYVDDTVDAESLSSAAVSSTVGDLVEACSVPVKLD